MEKVDLPELLKRADFVTLHTPLTDKTKGIIDGKAIAAGLREVWSRPPAALGLRSFQMLRYQFWGFGLFTFALYAKNLVEGGDASNVALAISGAGGFVSPGNLNPVICGASATARTGR